MPKINDTILQSIITSQFPVDYNTILQYLESKKITPNKTTIYRNIEKLENKGTIRKVLLSDKKQYWEKTQTSSQYHFHLICNLCKTIECRELSNSLDLNLADFLIQKTDLNLFGLCRQCQ